MRILLHTLVFLTVAGFFPASVVYAYESYVFDVTTTQPTAYFDKASWLLTKHPEVLSFTTLDNGDAYGSTTTNVPFRQYTIKEQEGLRVQRFEIEDHYHFIVNGVIIGSLEALSVQLASVYNALH